MLKKPHIIKQRHPVSVHEIEHGIELEKYLQRPREIVYIPHDGSDPDTHLKQYAYDLPQIPEEHHHRAGDIREPQHQQEGTQRKIRYLYPVRIGIDTVQQQYHQRDSHKEHMDEKCGKDLDDGEDADLEHHLLHKELVRQQRTRPLSPCIGKEEPGHNAHYEPYHKRIALCIRYRCPSSHGEDKPVYQHRHRRLQEYPDYAHVRSRILGAEVVFGQLPYELPVGEELLGKQHDPVIELRKYAEGTPENENGDALLDLLLYGYCQRIVMQDDIKRPDDSKRRHGKDCLFLSLHPHSPRRSLYSAKVGQFLSLSLMLRSAPFSSGHFMAISGSL